MKNSVSKYLPDDALDEIVRLIADTEKKTSGEIRLCLRRKRGFLEKNKSPREVAVSEFFRLNMDKTKHKTGVLMFLLLDEHKFEIIADEGINSKIPEEGWNEISKELISFFKDEKYLDGIKSGIQKIGSVLIREFPVAKDDRNELSDEIVIG